MFNWVFGDVVKPIFSLMSDELKSDLMTLLGDLKSKIDARGNLLDKLLILVIMESLKD